MSSWHRLLWGIEHYSVAPSDERVMLLGAGWMKETRISRPAYYGEPLRALLFTTRAAARAWCAAENARYRAYPEGHICRDWRVRVVRVVERVEKVEILKPVDPYPFALPDDVELPCPEPDR